MGGSKQPLDPGGRLRVGRVRLSSPPRASPAAASPKPGAKPPPKPPRGVLSLRLPYHTVHGGALGPQAPRPALTFSQRTKHGGSPGVRSPGGRTCRLAESLRAAGTPLGTEPSQHVFKYEFFSVLSGILRAVLFAGLHNSPLLPYIQALLILSINLQDVSPVCLLCHHSS